MLYARFNETGKSSVQTLLLPAFQEYLAAYIDVVKGAPIDASAVPGAREAQKEYDEFNADRDPAHGLFTSYFGEQWANDFVHDFLFTLADQPTHPEYPQT